MKKLTSSSSPRWSARGLWAAALLALLSTTPARADAPPAAPEKAPAVEKAAAKTVKEVTLHGTLGCGKCSFREASACQNVLKVKNGAKEDTYVLADNAVSEANHDKVCGPTSPATITGAVSKPDKRSHGRKVLTASAIKLE
ncbi:MAG TPA: DUF6370 family protein [Polyangia bacterium]|jgi:hypothetical protein|nr:DUF6370 family protein [Polyangia bacterium]